MRKIGLSFSYFLRAAFRVLLGEAFLLEAFLLEAFLLEAFLLEVFLLVVVRAFVAADFLVVLPFLEALLPVFFVAFFAALFLAPVFAGVFFVDFFVCFPCLAAARLATVACAFWITASICCSGGVPGMRCSLSAFCCSTNSP